MKNKKKVIILVCILTVIAILAVAAAIMLTAPKEKYRVIKVNNTNGVVTVERDYNGERNKLDAFEGMQLVSLDTVTVGSEAFLELLADSDKHIGAEADTAFFLLSEGNEEAGMLRIELLCGRALFTIDNKLNDESTFEVSTPNALLSVRGTRFSVAYDEINHETFVEVFDGIVWAEYANGSSELYAGQSITIDDSGNPAPDSNNPSGINENEEATANPEELKHISINRVYNDETDIESSAIYEYLNLFVYDETGDIRLLSGGYTNYPNSSITSGFPKLDSETERLEKEYIAVHKADIDRIFMENRQSATEIYANGGEPEAIDVTEWFPEELSIEGEEEVYTYRISRVELKLCVNAIRAITAADGTANEAPPNSFVDGSNYSRVQSVTIEMYGLRK